jgi:DNA-binding LacI/PurR family transcriptional regulator
MKKKSKVITPTPTAPRTDTRKKITLTEVAEQCKVSRATVSRILNNRLNGFPVSEDTRQKVLQTAHALGYRANRLARAIRHQRTNLIALSFPTYMITGRMIPENVPERAMNFGDCISSVFNHPLFEKYDLVIHGRKEYQQEQLTEADFQTDLLDGLIYLTPSERHREFIEYARPDFPIILVGQLETGNEQILAVDVDNRKAAQKLTRHLVDRGCKKILCAYVKIYESFLVTRDRIEGFRQTLRDAGITVEETDIISCEYSVEGGRSLVDRFTDKQLAGIDGFVAMAEYIGDGIVDGLTARGLSVPNDIAVTGFAFSEDRSPHPHQKAEWRYPVIAIPVRQMIYIATDHLLKILEGVEEYEPGFREVESDLIIPV